MKPATHTVIVERRGFGPDDPPRARGLVPCRLTATQIVTHDAATRIGHADPSRSPMTVPALTRFRRDTGRLIGFQEWRLHAVTSTLREIGGQE